MQHFFTCLVIYLLQKAPEALAIITPTYVSQETEIKELPNLTASKWHEVGTAGKIPSDSKTQLLPEHIYPAP